MVPWPLQILLLGCFSYFSVPGALPQQAAASGTATEADQLQPALVALTQAVRQLRIDKWKAPGPVRDDAARNVNSIETDLDTTLPSLITATVPSSPTDSTLAPTFAVYRNIDALYDVVLRVSLTAELAAPDVETDALDHALARLESARKALGDSIAGGIRRQQQKVLALEAAAAAAPPPAPAAPTKTVVEDGPQSAPKAARKKKAAPPPPQ
jgi:hypothetical protein